MKAILPSDHSIFSRRSRVELPPTPIWVAALPIALTAAGKRDPDQILNSALFAASAALAADDDRRSSRARICFLIAELGHQFGRRVGDYSTPIPVSRNQLARASGIGLTKVKRLAAFLCLAGVIEVLPSGIQIIDWERLCALARYDRSWVPVPAPDEEAAVAMAHEEASKQPEISVTVAGEPASFV